MIVVTGANGFIGNVLIKRLNEENFNAIVAVDEFRVKAAHNYLKGLRIYKLLHFENLPEWLKRHGQEVEFVFHLGAITDTLETDQRRFQQHNIDYPKMLWKVCCEEQIPFVYASSAATYGAGEQGFKDDHALIPKLKPLNAYGQSKQDFDIWALEQKDKPFYWCGLKFFNVYGPKEGHKKHMASMVYQAYLQATNESNIRLFASSDSEIGDGEQTRDFVYIDDVVNTLYWLMNHRKHSGIYNLGSGISSSFNDIVKHLSTVLDEQITTTYFEPEEKIKQAYQNHTVADMQKLKSIGCPMDFMSLEEGILEYVDFLKGLNP